MQEAILVLLPSLSIPNSPSSKAIFIFKNRFSSFFEKGLSLIFKTVFLSSLDHIDYIYNSLPYGIFIHISYISCSAQADTLSLPTKSHFCCHLLLCVTQWASLWLLTGARTPYTTEENAFRSPSDYAELLWVRAPTSHSFSALDRPWASKVSAVHCRGVKTLSQVALMAVPVSGHQHSISKWVWWPCSREGAVASALGFVTSPAMDFKALLNHRSVVGAWKSRWRVWSPANRWLGKRWPQDKGKGFAGVSLTPTCQWSSRWDSRAVTHSTLPIMHQRGCPYQNISQCDLQRNSEHGWISWLFPLTDIFFPLLSFLSFISFPFRCFPWTEIDVISVTKKKKVENENLKFVSLGVLVFCAPKKTFCLSRHEHCSRKEDTSEKSSSRSLGGCETPWGGLMLCCWEWMKGLGSGSLHRVSHAKVGSSCRPHHPIGCEIASLMPTILELHCRLLSCGLSSPNSCWNLVATVVVVVLGDGNI